MKRDFVVVGGGLVGLATARALLERRPGATLAVLEKEPDLGRHQSGRNSGVVHAGVYYAPGSLKATLCREGRAALLAFADEHAIPYAVRGKVIVATREAELPRLEELRRRALANGVEGVRELDPVALREIEPHVAGLRGLHVPESAVIDYRAVLAALADDVRGHGGEVLFGRTVERVEEVDAGRVVVCAGLQADRLARTEHRIVPFRGDYLVLRGPTAQLVRGLVYPVPDLRSRSSVCTSRAGTTRPSGQGRTRSRRSRARGTGGSGSRGGTQASCSPRAASGGSPAATGAREAARSGATWSRAQPSASSVGTSPRSIRGMFPSALAAFAPRCCGVTGHSSTTS